MFSVRNLKSNKFFLKRLVIIIFGLIFICSNVIYSEDSSSSIEKERDSLLREIHVKNNIDNYLLPDTDSEIMIKVFVSSECYIILQEKGSKSFKYLVNSYKKKKVNNLIKRFNIVNLTRDAVVALWVSPYKGYANKVIPSTSTYVRELDKIIIDDLSGWHFKYFKRSGGLKKVIIKYRIMLKKN